VLSLPGNLDEVTIAFRPLAADDLPQVALWLGREHVQVWWQEPSDIASVEEKYGPRVRGEDTTAMFIVVRDGREIGLIQSYRLADEPDWRGVLARTGITLGAAAGIDYLIGEPDLIGQGIGSEVVAAFTEDVYARYPDVDEIVVTPQLANRASCRVLERAGYTLVWTGELQSDDPSDAGTAALFVHRREQ
jgi:aminoglycoside 6'-N-acetyltransferase